MQLSARLERIMEMAGDGDIIADIGTDHGYIPIELVRRGHYSGALAMDVRKGPLERAQSHIADAGLQHVIRTRLSDGMDKMTPGEADTIVIAGMGGHLMAQILTKGADAAAAAKRIILSPHYDVEFFHGFLLENAYKVEDEQWIFDENKFYVVIRCRKLEPGEMTEVWSAEEMKYGRIPLEQRQETLIRHARKDLEGMELLIRKLSGNEGERSREKIHEIEEQLEIVRRALTSMEHSGTFGY